MSPERPWRPLGELLVERGAIDEDQLDMAGRSVAWSYVRPTPEPA